MSSLAMPLGIWLLAAEAVIFAALPFLGIFEVWTRPRFATKGVRLGWTLALLVLGPLAVIALVVTILAGRATRQAPAPPALS